jgi:aspartyl-tRNA(Asn)/glutamyl-tRNA(Gln) amidotransferase subunit B
MDYRYFPEPDLLPLELEDDFIAECRATLPELPIDKRLKYLNDWKLAPDDARLLTTDHILSAYFEKLVELSEDVKKATSYLTSVVIGLIKESDDIQSVDQLRFDIAELAKVIKLVNSDELSSTNAKQVIEELFNNG